MKIDDKNKFSYSENEEFDNLSEFDIEHEAQQVVPARHVVRELPAYEKPP